eukprot:s4704_g1.t1
MCWGSWLGPVPGTAFGDIDLHFVWHAWNLATWTFTLCRRHGTYGTQLALVTRLVPINAAALLRGRRGIWRHRPSVRVAGVALGDMELHGTQLALVTLLGHGGAAPFCVAGVALEDIDCHFVWQAWQLATWTFTLCGRPATHGIQLALVTGLVPVGAAALLRGRRGIWRHRPSFRVAGVARDMDLHFVWQAWHVWHSAGSCYAPGSRWRHGSFAWQTWLLETSTSIRVARMALGDMDLHFVWQACHLWHSAGSCDALGSRHFVWQESHLETSAFTLCGRRGTWRHGPSLCVAGMAFMALSWLL